MSKFRTLLPLFALCCLLAVMAGVAADSKHSDKHHYRGHFGMDRHSHHSRRPHSPRGHHSHHLRRRYRVRVRTACHGRTLRLGCQGGYQIRVLGAFYGRTSNRICAPLLFKFGHRHRSSHVARCSAHDSLDKARRHCQGKRHCRLAASGSVFGKPCSSKSRAYLRVRYTCVFRACRKVVWLQAKLAKLIARYSRLAKHSYGYWRRRHFRRRSFRLKRKLDRLRRRFHFCFKCKRGCRRIRKLLSRLQRAETRVHSMLAKLSAKKHSAKKGRGHLSLHHSLRARAGRFFLKRKLGYLRARQHLLRRKLRRCTRVCRY